MVTPKQVNLLSPYEEIKQGELLADEGGELLTDEEEKQVWEKFQGKVEYDE